ncbi:MAG: ABC transporter [Rhodospirillales bacterium RIFCSPLOWO2_12_FULL_58_28]|nr:MAG: ABC transporter [Rhodospirillales bacterium RIFCSPLOWO2_02_FULL_58_16]OHC76758.1 MAG: ABC transporter [Rhodospirillales bacterium RIFCSPLOWO2_12_FULL_58_28]
MSKPVLRLDGVKRVFEQGKTVLEVLRGVDLEIREGQTLALVGPSGSGKSTLLHVAGLLEKADCGEVTICGETASSLNDDARTRLRRHNIGFVYQYHHLLPEFTALENIMIPQIIAGISRSEATMRAAEMLEWLGLAKRATHRPARLSGGEQQRVAIGRALANTPRLLLADEPTGNLDPETAGDVFEVLIKLVRGAGLAAVIATHNPDLAARMDRIVSLRDGLLVEE